MSVGSQLWALGYEGFLLPSNQLHKDLEHHRFSRRSDHGNINRTYGDRPQRAHVLQSSIEALRSSRSRSEVVIRAKENFNLAGGQIGLAWLKAHAGNPGNELADHHAKLAAIQGVEMHLPTPYSCLKHRISKNLIREWGEFWDGSQSESGHRIRSFVAGVDKNF
ncbi:hypothetical protein AVEN_234227-1 [Araneus ventricosus]|uniref:Uncharacterized protein n=1 Tax=Araneus ventricosus TaxID=182803 RepID=A0A4Y2A7Y2_ARAVE|nr:hypothetical protein AVEN_234227-1 [Araneus ventricosus]